MPLTQSLSSSPTQLQPQTSLSLHFNSIRVVASFFHLLLQLFFPCACNRFPQPCQTPPSDFYLFVTGNAHPSSHPHPPPPVPPSSAYSTSEINEHIDQHPWGSPGFCDPGILDAKLSTNGVALARSRAPAFQSEHAQFLADARLIVSSPLTRALQTAELLLPQPAAMAEVPMLMLPLASERVYLK